MKARNICLENKAFKSLPIDLRTSFFNEIKNTKTIIHMKSASSLVENMSVKPVNDY